MASKHEYSVIRDEVLADIIMVQLDKLEKPGQEKGILPKDAGHFRELKRQHIEYLITACVASSIGARTSPPIQVDELWHLHLLETESYDALCALIIRKVKKLCPDLKITKIHHSSVENQEGRGDRLKATKLLYKQLGFYFAIKIFPIQVKGHPAGNHVLHVTPDTTVGELKLGVNMIHGHNHVDYEFKFHFGSKPLESVKTLRAYNIKEDDTLHVVQTNMKRRDLDEVQKHSFSHIIYMRTLTDKIIPLLVTPYTSVDELMLAVSMEMGCPPERMHLIFAGKEISHERKIQDYNIQGGSIVHLVLKLCGC